MLVMVNNEWRPGCAVAGVRRMRPEAAAVIHQGDRSVLARPRPQWIMIHYDNSGDWGLVLEKVPSEGS